jgi:hypothetical protein
MKFRLKTSFKFLNLPTKQHKIDLQNFQKANLINLYSLKELIHFKPPKNLPSHFCVAPRKFMPKQTNRL